MREIKFRAWNIARKMMIENIHLTHENRLPSNYEQFYIIEQYTGLKDKNGKEIYEGDIVKVDVYDDYEKRVIQWDVINARFISDQMENFLPDNMKVIGNIHQNPELLK